MFLFNSQENGNENQRQRVKGSEDQSITIKNRGFTGSGSTGTRCGIPFRFRGPSSQELVQIFLYEYQNPVYGCKGIDSNLDGSESSWDGWIQPQNQNQVVRIPHGNEKDFSQDQDIFPLPGSPGYLEAEERLLKNYVLPPTFSVSLSILMWGNCGGTSQVPLWKRL
jgi:hypothetical protein